jgi:hypothetical protein
MTKFVNFMTCELPSNHSQFSHEVKCSNENNVWQSHKQLGINSLRTKAML